MHQLQESPLTKVSADDRCELTQIHVVGEVGRSLKFKHAALFFLLEFTMCHPQFWGEHIVVLSYFFSLSWLMFHLVYWILVYTYIYICDSCWIILHFYHDTRTFLCTVHVLVCAGSNPPVQKPATFAGHHPRFLEADQVNGGAVQWDGFCGDSLSTPLVVITKLTIIN